MNNKERLKISRLQRMSNKMTMGKFIRYLLLGISTCISSTYLIWCYVVYDIESKSPTPTIRVLGLFVILFGFITMSIGIYNAKAIKDNNDLLSDTINLNDIHMDETLKIKSMLDKKVR